MPAIGAEDHRLLTEFLDTVLERHASGRYGLVEARENLLHAIEAMMDARHHEWRTIMDVVIAGDRD